MSVEKKCGVITIIEELNSDLKIENLKVFFKDVEPLLKNSSLNIEDISQHLDHIIDKMSRLTNKANLTYQLVHNVIDSIHSSRKELKQSVDGLLKQTGNQLHKITSTTQDATNKILDEADKLNSDQEIIISKLDELACKCDMAENNNKIIAEIKDMVYSNQESTFNIMGHLQFQDITAQQISGAYSLLSDTEKTLLYVSNLMKEFDFGENDPDILLPSIDKNAFNAGATFKDKTDIQGLIDDLFDTGNESMDIPVEEEELDLKHKMDVHKAETGAIVADDIDIDALFGKQDSAASNQGAIASVEVAEDGELDIDALFNKPSATTETIAADKQEPNDLENDGELDIDALFNKPSAAIETTVVETSEPIAVDDDGELDIDALFNK